VNKAERKIVYQKCGGCCAYCGEKLGNGWQVDHVRPQNIAHQTPDIDNDRDENLLPACRSCNATKSSYQLEAFRKRLEEDVARLHRDSSKYRILKRFGLIQETGKPVKFYFEVIKEME